MPIRFYPAARADIKDALRWSLVHFGPGALRRYQRLITVALSEIAADPCLAHSYELSGLQSGIRLYHLRHSRKRAAIEGRMVREPRHFIAYRVLKSGVTIVRLLHDRMEIVRQLEQG